MPTDPSADAAKDVSDGRACIGRDGGEREGLRMLKMLALLAMAGVLLLAAGSNSNEGFRREAGLDTDADPAGD